MRTPKVLRIRLRKHRPHRISITNRAKIRPQKNQKKSKSINFLLKFTFQGNNSFIHKCDCPQTPLDQESFTHPDNYVQFWAIFATKISPKYSSSLCDKSIFCQENKLCLLSISNSNFTTFFKSKTNTHIVVKGLEKKKCRKIKVRCVKNNKGCARWICCARLIQQQIASLLGVSRASRSPRSPAVSNLLCPSTPGMISEVIPIHHPLLDEQQFG